MVRTWWTTAAMHAAIPPPARTQRSAELRAHLQALVSPLRDHGPLPLLDATQRQRVLAELTGREGRSRGVEGGRTGALRDQTTVNEVIALSRDPGWRDEELEVLLPLPPSTPIALFTCIALHPNVGDRTRTALALRAVHLRGTDIDATALEHPPARVLAAMEIAAAYPDRTGIATPVTRTREDELLLDTVARYVALSSCARSLVLALQDRPRAFSSTSLVQQAIAIAEVVDAGGEQLRELAKGLVEGWAQGPDALLAAARALAQ